MTTETKDANERVALLLGWEWFEPEGEARHWISPMARSKTPLGAVVPTEPMPDYTQWDRFPEMQEYVRGLPWDEQWPIVLAMREETGGITIIWRDITPTILRDAIDSVCGEEA